MKPDVLLSHSEDPATGPSSDPLQSSPHPDTHLPFSFADVMLKNLLRLESLCDSL